MVEIIGYTGMFDYVELVAEYAPYSLFSLDNVGRAIELFDHMTGMIKIEQESRLHLATRAISSGIQNVLFSDIRSAAEVVDCVRAVRAETPQTGGLHGARHGRDVGVFLEAGSPAFVQSLEDAVIAIMIEKKEAVENLEEILAVEGVDMVQFGPADYSMSIGKAGNKKAPEVVEAQHYMIKTALKHGVAPRVEIGDPREAEDYLDLGVRHFSLGTDVTTIYNWCKENGSRLRDVLRTVSSVADGG
ncbi:MAG: 2,4-dihydroxyhept-2-ene-1,7-dioic acid aldolase [Chloroflexi bacterium]|nr:2,4-dihydroxyhept-2-ene-1,7-dioic acid aldolase [Chloroflexota bacterium]